MCSDIFVGLSRTGLTKRDKIWYDLSEDFSWRIFIYIIVSDNCNDCCIPSYVHIICGGVWIYLPEILLVIYPFFNFTGWRCDSLGIFWFMKVMNNLYYRWELNYLRGISWIFQDKWVYINLRVFFFSPSMFCIWEYFY